MMSVRHLELADTIHEVTLEPADEGMVSLCIDDGTPVAVTLPPRGATVFTLRWNERTRRVAVARVGKAIEVSVDGERFVVRPSSPRPTTGGGEAVGGPVRAPMPGKVVELPVAAGDAVARGDTVAVVEAMKLRTSLTAGADGTVKAIYCSVGDQVAAGDTLVEIEEEDDD